MDLLVILHGTNIVFEHLPPIFKKYNLPCVPHDRWNGDKGYVVYGPLYIVVDGEIRPTILQSHIEDANCVIGANLNCQKCLSCRAKLFYDVHLCLQCANNILQAQPPIISYRGAIDLQESNAIITLHTMPLCRLAKCSTIYMSIASAIAGIDVCMPHQYKRVYHLTYPHTLTHSDRENVDNIVDDACNHQVRIVWE